MLIALHGRGEAGRGLDVGAKGWRDDYGVERLHQRLSSGKVSLEDLFGMGDASRIAGINASLAATPFRGISLVTPATPVLADPSPEGAGGFAKFLTDELLARVTEARGVSSKRERTGIDGVSMGGRLSLLIGALAPEHFTTVGALQPAIHVNEAPRFAELLASAHARHAISVRLVTSTEDPFLEPTRALASALSRTKVPCQLVVTPGPHDYTWNRGPGSCELLLFHERALRGLSSP